MRQLFVGRVTDGLIRSSVLNNRGLSYPSLHPPALPQGIVVWFECGQSSSAPLASSISPNMQSYRLEDNPNRAEWYTSYFSKLPVLEPPFFVYKDRYAIHYLGWILVFVCKMVNANRSIAAKNRNHDPCERCRRSKLKVGSSLYNEIRCFLTRVMAVQGYRQRRYLRSM